jgi:Domain of unknown function (DUF4136)
MSHAIRNRLTRIGMMLSLALVMCGVASAQDVSTNKMPGADFSKFHTYRWVSVEGAEKLNQIVDAQIKQSIDTQLASKGLTKTTDEKADLLIGYQPSLNQEKEWNAYGTGGGLRWGGGMASAQSSTINIGTLVVDMYDPATKQLVWTGRATKTLNPGDSAEKKQKNLDSAMKKLFKKFP